MSTSTGAELFCSRHTARIDQPLTREDVTGSPLAAGAARWAALHATKPVTGPDGSTVQRPDPEARAAARALLSAEDQAEVDRLQTGQAASAAGSDSTDPTLAETLGS